VQPLQAFILDTANRIINVIVRVPFKVGFDEGAGSAVGDAIGVGPAGLTMALVRKGRLVVWAIVGGVLLLRRRMP